MLRGLASEHCGIGGRCTARHTLRPGIKIDARTQSVLARGGFIESSPRPYLPPNYAGGVLLEISPHAHGMMPSMGSISLDEEGDGWSGVIDSRKLMGRSKSKPILPVSLVESSGSPKMT